LLLLLLQLLMLLLLLVLLLLLLLLLLEVALRRCGTGLVGAGGSTITGAGGDRLLLPAVAIEVLEDRAGVQATAVLVLVPKLQIK